MFFFIRGKKCYKKKGYDLFYQFCQHHLFHYRFLVSRHLLTALFQPEYGLWKMVELRYKGKYWVSVPVTTTDAAAKVKESAKSKANYQQTYFNFVEMDLIASEFKLHKECQKMLTRPVRPQTDTTQGDLIGNFDKLVSDID